MVSMGSIVAKLQLNIDNFTANMKNAENHIKKLDDKFSGYEAIGGMFTDLGTKLTLGLTVPLAGAATAATNLASTFEEKLSKVKAVSGSTSEEMAKIKETAMEMGAKTKFSAGESADAMTYMAMAGWNAGQMIDGIGGIMSLAASDGLDLATTSDIVTDALTAFGMKASDSGRFADVLAAASSSANTSVSMLGESFKYVAPVAGSLGYSVEDASIALGIMANSGIKAGQAGTALRAAISRMLKPTDDAAGLMDEYGISLTNTDGTMKTLSEVMGDLRANMGDLNEAEKAQAATTIFGQEAMSGMLALINSSDEDFNKLSEAIYNSEGVADSMAATMQDNLKGKIEELGGAVETLGIQIGDMLIPHISKVVEKVTGWVEKFTQMNDGTKKVILVIAGLVAGIGPLVFGIGGAIKMYGKFQQNMELIKNSYKALANSQMIATAKTKIMTAATKALNFVMGLSPMTWVIIGIVALVATFVILWKKCEWFRKFWIDLWEVLKEKVSVFWEWLKGIFTNVWESVKSGWEKFKTGFTELWNSVKNWFSELWNSILAIVQKGVDWVMGIWSLFSESITQIWEGLKLYFQGWWEIIKNVFLGFLLIIIDIVTGDFGRLKEDIANIWNNIKEGFKMVWEGIKNIFTGTLSAIWIYIKTVWKWIWDNIVQVWNAITKWLGETLTKIGQSISTAWNNFKTAIANKCIEIYNSVKEWFNKVIEWLKALPGRLYQIGSDMFNRMKSGVVSTVSGVYTSITQGVGRAVTWLKDLPGQARTWGKHMIEGFITGIKDKVGALVDSVRGVGSKIRDFLGFSIPKKGPLHVYMEWMPHMIQGMTASLKDESPLLFNAAKDVAGSLSDSMTSVDPDVKPKPQPGGAGAIAELTDTLKQFMEKVGTPTAVFNVNGREFATATAGDMSKALAERMR